MKARQPLSDAQVDSLVAAHLTQQAEGIDSVALLQRIKARRHTAPAAPTLRPQQWRLLRRWGWSVTAALLLVATFVAGLYLGPSAQASAETIVREAQRVHALPMDRCYLVQATPEPGGLLERQPPLLQKREMRLWTRGDRFWLESTNPEQRWKLGRDDQGRLWVALGTRQGLRLEKDEYTDSMGVLCDLYSMQVETLLNEVLQHFELTRQGPIPHQRGTYLIQAEPLRDRFHARLRSAELEVDAETKVLQRLVLHRAFNGRPTATVTFTLLETSPQLDRSYQLEGHLEPRAPIYTRQNERGRRAMLLQRYFGIAPAPKNKS